MYRICYPFVGVVISAVTVCSVVGGGEVGACLEEKRVEQWAALLPAMPRGVGPTIADRQAWQAVARPSDFKMPSRGPSSCSRSRCPN